MLNFNGELTQSKETTFLAQNRAFQYGDGVFETLRVLGGKIVFWEDHYFRLMASMRILRMEIPMDFSPEFLEEEILKTIKAQENPQANFRVKLVVCRKPGGYYLPQNLEVDFLMTLTELDQPFYLSNNLTYRVELFKDHYITSGLLSSLKSTNKIINILASIYAQENDYQNCLLLNESKMVVEAANANLFWVKGKQIKTPPVSEGCLNGIIRKKLIEIIEKLPAYNLVEEKISPFDLQKADELFLTNSIQGIQSISVYRKKQFKHAVADELRGKLNALARLS
jgi:branched-chain amino acid aminotransferase